MSRRRLLGQGAGVTAAALLGLVFFASCEEKNAAPPFHSPLDLLPGSAHTIWIWDAPYPKEVPFFLWPPVPPKLLNAKEGALSLVHVETRRGEADAPIGGFDFGDKQANDQVLAELQGLVFRDLRFGTVSDLILLRGQLKADDVGGPGLSHQPWFVKTKLGLDLLLPDEQKGSLRLILDPRRSGMLTSWTQKIPKQFQSVLGYRSFLSFGVGTKGQGSLVAYGQLVREPEGLVAGLREIPENLVVRFRGTKASWICLGLDLPSFITEGLASLSASNDPMQGGAMDFLTSPFLSALGPFGDPKVRESLGSVLAIATQEELGQKMSRDPSRFLFLLGLRDAVAFEAALAPLVKESSGRGAKFFRLEKKGEHQWRLQIFGFTFGVEVRKGFALLSTSRTRELAAKILEAKKGAVGGSGGKLLEGSLRLGKKVFKLGLRKLGTGLAFEMK